MNEDLDDYELVKTPPEAPPASMSPTASMAPWVGVALLVVAIGAGVYIAFGKRPPPSATPQPIATAPVITPQPLGGPPESIVVPPLDESDPVVRTLVQKLSDHP